MKLNRDALKKLPFAMRVEIEENAQRMSLTQKDLGIEQRRILTELRKLKTPGARTDLTAKPTALQRGGILEKAFSEDNNRATAIVGELYQESHKQVEKRLAVLEAAEAEPERFGKLLDDMDRSGSVNGPHRRLVNMRQAEQIRAEPSPLPNRGPYRAATIDIPWAYEPDDDDAAQRGALPYATVSIEQACAFARDKIAPLMHDDAVLGFWVTNFILAKGLHVPVLAACAFEPKTLVTWPKHRPGRGHYAKGQTEHLIIATRGRPVVTLTDQTTLLQGPFHLVNKGAHSSKPVEAYSYFESLFPAPRYADLFSRYRHNEKWDCHGHEAPIDADDTVTIDAEPVQP